MSSFYTLRINTTEDVAAKLNLEFKHNHVRFEPFFELEIREDSELYSKAINYFLDLVEKNRKTLEAFAVETESISIWYFYEYEEQCNMEFEPYDLKRMGDNNIALCISCWEK